MFAIYVARFVEAGFFLSQPRGRLIALSKGLPKSWESIEKVPSRGAVSLTCPGCISVVLRLILACVVYTVPHT